MLKIKMKRMALFFSNAFIVVVYVVLVGVTSQYIHEWTHIQQELKLNNTIVEVCYFGETSRNGFKPTFKSDGLNRIFSNYPASGWVEIPGSSNIPTDLQYVFGLTLQEYEAYRNQIIYFLVLTIPIFVSIYLDDTI